MESELYEIVNKAKKYDDLLKIQGVFERLQCSFCGKSQDNVDRIVAGKNVYICNECIILCAEIVDESKEE